jgi:predicted aspartyl protease
VDPDRIPYVGLPLADRTWRAVIDSGFNGDVELPLARRAQLDCTYAGPVLSYLAAGQAVEEESYVVRLPFDGEIVSAEATFVTGDEILIGTRLLPDHRLTIDFPAGTVHIERTAGD